MTIKKLLLAPLIFFILPSFLVGCDAQDPHFHGFDLISNPDKIKMVVSHEKKIGNLQLEQKTLAFSQQLKASNKASDLYVAPIIDDFKKQDRLVLQFPLKFEGEKSHPSLTKKESREREFVDAFKKILSLDRQALDPASWENISGKWSISGGKVTPGESFQLQGMGDGGNKILFNKNNVFANGVINATITFDNNNSLGSDPDILAGIIFRAKDEKNFNQLLIDDSGRAKICRYSEGLRHCYDAHVTISPDQGKFKFMLAFVDEAALIFSNGKWHNMILLPYVIQDEGFIGLFGFGENARIFFEDINFVGKDQGLIPENKKKTNMAMGQEMYKNSGLLVKNKDNSILTISPMGKNQLTFSTLASNLLLSRVVLSAAQQSDLSNPYWVIEGNNVNLFSSKTHIAKFTIPGEIKEVALINGAKDKPEKLSIRLAREKSEGLNERESLKAFEERLVLHDLLTSKKITSAGGSKRVPTFRVRIDQDTRDCFSSLPTTEIHFSSKVPANSFLHLGTGILPQAFEKSDGVLFQVLAGKKGKKAQELMFDFFDPQKETKPKWKDHKIALKGLEGEEIEFVLKTTGKGNMKGREKPYNNDFDFGLWSRPVILQKKNKDKPNVIYISLDTLRADRLGIYGYHRNTSPNIDLLAKKGAMFKNAYVQAPWTTPSHISMFTSQYPSSLSKSFDLGASYLPESAETIFEILGRNGYLNMGFSGGGYLSATYGFSQGFYAYKEIFDIVVAFKKMEDWLENHHEDQFCLLFHTWGYTIYKEKKHEVFGDEDDVPFGDQYDSRIRFIDNFIGLLIKKLELLGILDETLIVLTSDHGEEIYDHGGEGHSHTLFNELLKVPLIVHYPKKIREGVVPEDSVRSLDVVPTILDYLGIEPSNNMEGVSLKGYVEGTTNGDLPVFSEGVDESNPGIIPGQKSYIAKDYKLIVGDPKPEGHFNKAALFNIKTDPLERKDLFIGIRPKDIEIAKDYASTINRIGKANKEKFKALSAKGRKKSKETKETLEVLKALGYIQ